MKRFLKPILTAFVLILALGILVPALTYVGQAAELVTSGSCGENLVWNYDTETQTLTISGTGEMIDYSGNGPWHSLTVRKVIIEEGVTTIGAYAFAFDNFKEVTLPESLRVIKTKAFMDSSIASISLPTGLHTIEDKAFEDCDSLQSVMIPGNVETIPHRAFYGCYILKEVVLNEGIRSVETSAFAYCDVLEKITLPSTLEHIGSYAFSECSSLSSVVIPSKVETIGFGAFEDTLLTELSIPASVTSIGKAIVSDCYKFQRFIVAEDNPMYCTDDNGILFTKDKSTLIQCPATFSGDYTVPDSVTSILYEAFYKCEGLTAITLPDQVTTIESYTFYECSSLVTVKLPARLRTIEISGFGSCSSLTDVELPNGLATIGDYAFYSCRALKSIVIPHSVTSMGISCFYSCPKLESVTLSQQLTEIPAAAFRYTSINNITIPHGVKKIGDGAFADTDLSYIVIPETVTSIGKEAFCNCEQLRKVYVKGNLPTIGYGAFDMRGYEEGWIEDIVVYTPIPDLTLYYLEKYPAWEQCRDIKSKVLWDCDKALMPRHTLNVESDLSMNYAVKEAALEDYDMDTVYMECILDLYQGNDKTGTKTYTLYPEKRGDYYYFTLSNLTAVQMKDQICATVYGMKDGAFVCSPKDTYSIADYAYKTMSKTGATDALKTVCADILRYGASAQIYKGYRTDALADAAMTEEQKSYLSDMTHLTFGNTDYIAEDVADPAVLWVGKALNLEARVAVKYIFTPGTYTGSVRDLTLKVQYVNHAGQTVEATLTNPELYDGEHERYAFTFDGLLAAELRTVLSAQIYSGDSPVSATLVYSPDTYGNGKTDTLGQLCKALFAYSDSVKTYFSSF